MLRVHVVIIALVLASVSHAADVPELARVFVDLPERYVAHVTKADRQRWLDEVQPFKDPYHNNAKGRNLSFSYDGEEPMSGNGPFRLHIFKSPVSRRVVGVALQREGAAAVHILSRRGGKWVEITGEVVPKSINPKLYYDFDAWDDVLSVSDYVLTRLHSYDAQPYLYPSKLLEKWRWTGERFAVVR
jgi:hypothetical protein